VVFAGWFELEITICPPSRKAPVPRRACLPLVAGLDLRQPAPEAVPGPGPHPLRTCGRRHDRGGHRLRHGYFSVAMGRMVGDKAGSLPWTLQQMMLDLCRKRAFRAGVSGRITTVLAAPDDIKVTGPVDLATRLLGWSTR